MCVTVQFGCELSSGIYNVIGDDGGVIQRVRVAIQKHYERCSGIIPSFGRVLGYDLVFRPGKDADFAVPYTVDGDRAGPIRTVPRLGEATLSSDGQRLSQSIWRQYGRRDRQG